MFIDTETPKYENFFIIIMKELEDLTTIEREILITFCDANKWSLSSHVPIQAVKRRIKNINPKIIKKTIKLLISNGFIMKHPTRHTIT